MFVNFAVMFMTIVWNQLHLISFQKTGFALFVVQQKTILKLSNNQNLLF